MKRVNSIELRLKKNRVRELESRRISGTIPAREDIHWRGCKRELEFEVWCYNVSKLRSERSTYSKIRNDGEDVHSKMDSVIHISVRSALCTW